MRFHLEMKLLRKVVARRLMLASLALAMCLVAAKTSEAVIVTVDRSAPWVGFMSIYELPANGGGFVFDSGWGVSDLVAIFDDPNSKLTLSPNTVGDPNEFWYQDTCACAADPVNPGGPGQAGNKMMDAALFVPDDSLVGQSVTFTGYVLSNSFTSDHNATAFIRDFAPDFSSFVDSTVPLTPGVFSVSLATINAAGRHVQYGFNTIGENVWVTDTGPFGNAMLLTIPEPSSFLLCGLGMVGLIGGLRRRR